MTQPLPLCARCGETLRGKARALLKWGARPGRPTIGWCLDQCDWGAKDDLWHVLKPGGDGGPSDGSKVDAVLSAIEMRGPGRVVRNKR